MLRHVTRLSHTQSLSASPVSLTTQRALSTVQVSAAMVKKLRELSGAPLMDCKNALANENVQGDVQKALDWLRAKGISKVSASQRETKEGLVGVLSLGESVTMVEVNCETDFVSMNQDFQRFVAAVGESVAKQYGASTVREIAPAEVLALPLADKPSATVEQALGDIVASIRETIVIKRAATFTPPAPHGVLASYVHNKVGASLLPAHVQLGKSAGLVHFSLSSAAGENDPAIAITQQALKEREGRRLAMHVVAAKPQFLAASDVPSDFLEKETAIFREQSAADAAKKKPEVVEKIIQGKVQKRLSEVCLLGQNHVAEEGSPVVKKFLESFSAAHKTTVNVKEFTLWSLNQA